MHSRGLNVATSTHFAIRYKIINQSINLLKSKMAKRPSITSQQNAWSTKIPFRRSLFDFRDSAHHWFCTSLPLSLYLCVSCCWCGCHSNADDNCPLSEAWCVHLYTHCISLQAIMPQWNNLPPPPNFLWGEGVAQGDRKIKCHAVMQLMHYRCRRGCQIDVLHFYINA